MNFRFVQHIDGKERIAIARFGKKKKEDGPIGVQTVRDGGHPFPELYGYTPLRRAENRLFEQIRLAVPIVDAGIQKLIRLMGSFEVSCGNERVDKELKAFLRSIPVSGVGCGIQAFLYTYLDSLLCYGNAVGEIVPQPGGGIYALYNAPLENIEVRRAANGLDTEMFIWSGGDLLPLKHPEFILFSALNPRAGEVLGRSLLEGLPFVTGILLKIFHAVGQNFDRVGNVRFAVTYKPGDTQTDKAYAKERAMAIAKEWSEAMSSSSVRDFIAVGDVEIRVIGADNQILDSNIPARQMLEQIVAKLGLPPFLLGLNWSTTERMSSQQADILTSELESYQALLDPVIVKICRTFLRLRGCAMEPVVDWKDLNLLDQVEGAKARLVNAQAAQIERQLEEGAE